MHSFSNQSPYRLNPYFHYTESKEVYLLKHFHDISLSYETTDNMGKTCVHLDNDFKERNDSYIDRYESPDTTFGCAKSK